MIQPLSRCRVLDFSQYLAGPYCTMLLGDFGADVVKVERPDGGDEARKMSPRIEGESYSFQLPNRNKRSIAVDLTSDAGRQIVRRLLERADVLVENARPGVMAKLGFDYPTVAAVRPAIVYCSISGFGQTGPISRRAGLDIIAQGMGGFMRLTGEPDHEPVKVGVAINDVVAGMTAANAILAAYIHRLRTGEGQYIDVSLLESGLAMTVWEAAAYFGSGDVATASGSRHRKYAPYQALATADGHVTVGVTTEVLWRRLCVDVLERPDLLTRIDFSDAESRLKNVEVLESELESIMASGTTAFWVERLESAGVPGGPVLGYAEALEQQQVIDRGVIVGVTHPTMGEIKVIAPAARLSATPSLIRSAAPMLGQHTAEVLSECGYSDGELRRLCENGTIAISQQFEGVKGV